MDIRKQFSSDERLIHEVQQSITGANSHRICSLLHQYQSVSQLFELDFDPGESCVCNRIYDGEAEKSDICGLYRNSHCRLLKKFQELEKELRIFAYEERKKKIDFQI